MLFRSRDELRAKLLKFDAEICQWLSLAKSQCQWFADNHPSGTNAPVCPTAWGIRAGESLIGRQVQFLRNDGQFSTEIIERDRLGERQPSVHPATEPSGDAGQLPAKAEPWRTWKPGTIVTTGRALRRIDTRDTDISLRTLWEQGYREQSSIGADGAGQS